MASATRVTHRKLGQHIPFPLHGLDLSSALASNVLSCPRSATDPDDSVALDRSDKSRTAPADSSVAVEDDGDATTYDLFGVVEHIGGVNSGHYIAYVRAPSGGYRVEVDDTSSGDCDAARFVPKGPFVWFKYDDSKVTRVSEDVVSRRKAYLLLYLRRREAAEVGAQQLRSRAR